MQVCNEVYRQLARPFRVLQVGLGTIGVRIARALLDRENMRLVAAVDVDPRYVGRTVEEIALEGSGGNIRVHGSVEEALSSTSPGPDVALVATASALEKVAPVIKACLRAGLDVVSICEELSFPFARHAALAAETDRLAREAGKTVLGTGINPGYLMDTLPIMMSAPVTRVDAVTVTRVIDSSKRRASFQLKIGSGMTVDEFREAIGSGKITGHVGLEESMRMIDSALGLGLDEFTEHLPEPVVAKEEVTTPVVKIPEGHVLGLKSVGEGRRGGETVLRLEFSAFAGASPEYDEVRIEGEPGLTERIEGGVHGDTGTVAMLLNVVPLVVRAPPGLSTMKDIPVPRNTARIMYDDGGGN